MDDLLIGASWAECCGESYVVCGRSTGFPAVFPLRRLHPDSGGDGSKGFILEGVDRQDYSGSSIGGAGDVNGDGVDDLIIGALRADTDVCCAFNACDSYVVFGRTSGFAPVFELGSLFADSGGDGSEGFVLAGYAEQGLPLRVVGLSPAEDDKRIFRRLLAESGQLEDAPPPRAAQTEAALPAIRRSATTDRSAPPRFSRRTLRNIAASISTAATTRP